MVQLNIHVLTEVFVSVLIKINQMNNIYVDETESAIFKYQFLTYNCFNLPSRCQ